MDTTLKLPQESVLVEAGDGDIANLVVQTVSRRVDLGVGGGVTGVEALSGRFFPKHFLCGSDLRRQIGLLQRPGDGNGPALRASFSALVSCPGILSAGVPGRRE